jgi:hypothetical protein
MASKILLVNQQNIRFLFRNTGEVYVNDEFKGAGALVTPIKDIGLRKNALFRLENRSFSTGPLKCCLIDD